MRKVTIKTFEMKPGQIREGAGHHLVRGAGERGKHPPNVFYREVEGKLPQ